MNDEIKKKMILTVGIDKFELEEDEAENIKKILLAGKKGIIELRNGEIVNIASIQSIKYKTLW